jgi:hypothetical protein
VGPLPPSIPPSTLAPPSTRVRTYAHTHIAAAPSPQHLQDHLGCAPPPRCAFVACTQADIGRDNMLAHFAAPVHVLRVGYRSCPLRNKMGKRIPFCNLLCMFTTRAAGATPVSTPVPGLGTPALYGQPPSSAATPTPVPGPVPTPTPTPTPVGPVQAVPAAAPEAAPAPVPGPSGGGSGALPSLLPEPVVAPPEPGSGRSVAAASAAAIPPQGPVVHVPPVPADSPGVPAQVTKPGDAASVQYV